MNAKLRGWIGIIFIAIIYMSIVLILTVVIGSKVAQTESGCLSCHISYDEVFQLVRAESRESDKRQDEVMTATDNELINAVNKYHSDKYNTWEE